MKKILSEYQRKKKEKGKPLSLGKIEFLYNSLGQSLIPINYGSDEFKTIKNWVEENQHPQKNQKLRVIDIFGLKCNKINQRNKEEERNTTMKKVLLFHGPHLSSVASLLVKGLRPKLLPLTKHPFPYNYKAIVLHDTSVASAVGASIYPNTPLHVSNEGCLVICEVKIGKMINLKEFEEMKKESSKSSSSSSSRIMNSFDILKIDGSYAPNQLSKFTCSFSSNKSEEEEVVRPSGDLLQKSTDDDDDDHSNLAYLFNQFIVSDPIHVTMKYLVHVKLEESNLTTTTTATTTATTTTSITTNINRSRNTQPTKRQRDEQDQDQDQDVDESRHLQTKRREILKENENENEKRNNNNIVWEFQTGKGWKEFGNDETKLLERKWKEKEKRDNNNNENEKEIEIEINELKYCIYLDKMIQVQKLNPSKKRKIRRITIRDQ